MTKYEEALKVMKQQREEAGQAFLGVVQFNVPQYYAVIEALEKQIPKKPIKANYLVNVNGIHTILDENEFRKCPSCHYKDVVLKHNQKYCHHCGQAIDWGEQNES